MILEHFNILGGDKGRRNLLKVKAIIDSINSLDKQMDGLGNSELADLTAQFRSRLHQGETLDELLPEAFAAVKQACRRLCGQSWEAGGIMISWEMIPFDEQLCGAIYLHRGYVTEMATGEGKTLVAAMPLYLNALEGQGVHLVTVNDYLARRDSEWLGPLYRMLGMSVGCILTDMTPEERRVAYNCDITYGTNNEFGFDYLRDNMAWAPEQLVQRGYHYAIIDEVDSVLVDEARTPLIISGQVDRSTHRFDRLTPMVRRLVQKQNALVSHLVAEAERLLEEPEGDAARRYEAGIRLLQARMGAPKHKRFMKVAGESTIQRLIDRVEHDFFRDKRTPELEEKLYFVVDEKSNTAALSERGRLALSPGDPDLIFLPDIAAELASVEAREDLTRDEALRLKDEAMARYEIRAEELQNIAQLLRAHVLYERDVDYVVQDNKVLIVDEFTGRLMPGRRWSDGLHQAVEAKEGVEIEKETQTLATITLQNYFRMYRKLAGMTGTAETEAGEFAHTYKMDVAVIPTHKPVRRMDAADLIYKTRREKYNAAIAEVQRLHEQKIPVLVGTTSVEVSEIISKMLDLVKIPHRVLNAKYHEREARIVAQAGQEGAVTIATNMAGRGTDIKLGSGVIRCGQDGTGTWCRGCAHRAPAGAMIDPDKPVCGLHIVGTERHEARRIDYQLRGRAGRQGDPGHSRFFVSLEDNLMRLFASERLAALIGKGAEEGQAIMHRSARSAMEAAQKKIEEVNFERRKRTLDYDDVMNRQREALYGLRRLVLLGEGNYADEIREITSEVLRGEWPIYASGKDPSAWDIRGFLDRVCRAVPTLDLGEEYAAEPFEIRVQTGPFLEGVIEKCAAVYARKCGMLGEEASHILARTIMLQTIDEHWCDHLLEIDELRDGIFLRGYGQLDPLVEFQREASLIFEEMMAGIYRGILEKIYQATLTQDQAIAGSIAQASHYHETIH